VIARHNARVTDVAVQILARLQRADGRRALANVVSLGLDGATIQADSMAIGEGVVLVFVVPGETATRVFVPATVVEVQEPHATLRFGVLMGFGHQPPTGMDGVSSASSLAAVRAFVQRRGGA
jgi:hypothetical protein